MILVKKILIFVLIALIVFTVCSQEPPTQEEKVFLEEVSVQMLPFEIWGGTDFRFA